MKTILVIYFVSLFALFYSQSAAQSANYTIESFQDVYIELANYESVGILAEGNPIFEIEFDLGFQFPFYDSLYNKIIYRGDSWGSMTDDEDEGLFLMAFLAGYGWADLNDTSNITSDIRFSNVFSNNMQAFVFQYTKMEFFADPFAELLDTYFNFQLWFYENGVMEVRFGEAHMDGTPIYEPGQGFYCYTTSGGVDTNEVCGPFMGISNPIDEEDAIALSGSYDDFEVVGEHYSVLNTIPPEGWVIRFKPKSVGVFDAEPISNQIVIAPNPTSSFIMIPKPGSKITIFDFSGKILYAGTATETKLDVSTLPPGIYSIKIASDDNSLIGRFFKL